MKIISLSVGQPQEIQWNGKSVKTSMAREKCQALELAENHIVGDLFANPKAHGTPETAVYAFSASRFSEWQKLTGRSFDAAEFGENITVDDFDEKDFFLGDVYQLGTAQIKVTGPRYPCVKLNFRFAREDMQSLFEKSNHPGVYFEIIKPGKVSLHDSFVKIKSSGSELSVFDLYKVMREVRTQKNKLSAEGQKLQQALLD